MTREEAINKLVNARYADEFQGDEELTTAHLMAINALEQEPCEDCVSRQTVLAEINNWWGITMTAGEPTICDYIRELPSVTPTTCIAKVTFSKDDLQELVDEKVKELAQRMESRWIPVSERLPENDEVVLGTNSSNDLFETNTWDDCGEIKWYANGCFDVPIIAWMPLPKPYKAEMEVEE